MPQHQSVCLAHGEAHAIDNAASTCSIHAAPFPSPLPTPFPTPFLAPFPAPFPAPKGHATIATGEAQPNLQYASQPNHPAPKGHTTIATGAAKRNPWEQSSLENPPRRGARQQPRVQRSTTRGMRASNHTAPEGRTHRCKDFVDTRRMQTRSPLRGGAHRRADTTGCAALHPWLLAQAPSGRHNVGQRQVNARPMRDEHALEAFREHFLCAMPMGPRARL
jgi:hypothetical protein